MYKCFWCIDFHTKQLGTVPEHCNHDNQSSQMLLVHPGMRLQSSPLDSVYLNMFLIALVIDIISEGELSITFLK